jgi:hypothetical protein
LTRNLVWGNSVTGLKQGWSVTQNAILTTGLFSQFCQPEPPHTLVILYPLVILHNIVIMILSSLQECITVQSPLYLLALHLKQAYSVAG